MAIDPKKLERLTAVLVRFLDPNEGTAISALNGFRAMCESQHIDLRDYELRPHDANTRDLLDNHYKTTEQLEAARDRNIQLMKKLDQAERERRAEVQRLEAKLRAEKTTNKMLRQKKSHNRDDGVIAKMSALEAELIAAKKTIGKLQKSNTDQSVMKALEAELNSYRDPWLEPVRQWLVARPNEHRHHTVAILCHALGVDEAVKIHRDAERRLAAIMRRIGGWEPSENVGGKYNRGPGYICK